MKDRLGTLSVDEVDFMSERVCIMEVDGGLDKFDAEKAAAERVVAIRQRDISQEEVAA